MIVHHIIGFDRLMNETKHLRGKKTTEKIVKTRNDNETMLQLLNIFDLISSTDY